MSLLARPGGLLAFWDGSRVGQNAKTAARAKKKAVGVFTHRLGPRERPHRTQVLPKMVDNIRTPCYGVRIRKGAERMNVKPKERTERLEIRMTVEEKETLKKLAAAAGVTMAGYLIGNALGDAIGQTILAGFDKKQKK